MIYTSNDDKHRDSPAFKYCNASFDSDILIKHKILSQFRQMSESEFR
jgi:hypothetical protein